MAKPNRISHFNGGGKTFFFNKSKAANDTEYLTINAMYGSPPKYERIVLFPQHLGEFSKHLEAAIEHLTGFTKACTCGSVIHPPEQEKSDGAGQNGKLGQ